jgi:hypothetical protein
MRPGPRAVADRLIADFPQDAAPCPLSGVVEDIIGELTGSAVDADEKASVWMEEIRLHLDRHLADCLQLGRQPRYAFNSSSGYMIQGACFVEPLDSPQVRAQKLNRRHWQDYHEALRQLDPRQFEVLCAKVLGLLGVPDPRLTPYQKDQGIDFYGRLSVGDLVGHGAVFPTFETKLVVWLIGQAKHFLHSQVATPDIRELVGSATLGRVRAFVHRDAFPDMSIRVCDPVVMLFFTTGQISSDGWSLCNVSGVAAMDGEMLAAFLADKGIGIHTDEGVGRFDLDVFNRWLHA